MIYFKQGQLSKKEESKFKFIIFDLPDVFSEFFITKNHLRLYIKEKEGIK